MELTTDEKYLLDGFNRMSKENRAIFLGYLRLTMECPGFRAAFDALIPPGEEIPSWENIKSLVKEWMAKEKSGGAA